MESYLLKTMDSNVLYFLVEKQGKIVSLASAEMDLENKSAEITDCLTFPSERGKGLIKELITALEKELSDRGFLECLYPLQSFVFWHKYGLCFPWLCLHRQAR